MKFISWNVNGIRACMGKGFEDFFKKTDADIFCLQETKLQEGQLAKVLAGESALDKTEWVRFLEGQEAALAAHRIKEGF